MRSAPSLGRHFDADLSGYGGVRVGVEPFVSVAMDGDGESASEDNNDYLSRKRRKEQARLYLLWGGGSLYNVHTGRREGISQMEMYRDRLKSMHQVA